MTIQKIRFRHCKYSITYCITYHDITLYSKIFKELLWDAIEKKLVL